MRCSDGSFDGIVMLKLAIIGPQRELPEDKSLRSLSFIDAGQQSDANQQARPTDNPCVLLPTR